MGVKCNTHGADEKCWYTFDVFAKLRKATISLVVSVCLADCPSVRLSTWNNSGDFQEIWYLSIFFRNHNLKIYFWNKTLHVSDSSSVHHQEFFTVHRAMLYVLTACEQDQDGTAVPSWSFSQDVSKLVWYIPLLCVQWKTPDDGQRNSPKHVEFCSKNKFEKLVRLVGFIIRIFKVCLL